MTTCETARSAAPGLRERLSLNLAPVSLMSTRVGCANAWGNGPLSAGPIPTSSPGWADAFISDKHDLDQPPQKRARAGCEVDSTTAKLATVVGAYKPTGTVEVPILTCDELADILCAPPKCHLGECNLAPIILDLRSLPTQMFCRIKAAIGMPCESRVKMRLVLPHLDTFLHRNLSDRCAHCQRPLGRQRPLVVIYTETGSEHTPVWEGLMLHLNQHHTVNVKLLKGGFHEFRQRHSHLCEKTFGRLPNSRSVGCMDENARSASPSSTELAFATSSCSCSPRSGSCLTANRRPLAPSPSPQSFLLPGLKFSFESVHPPNVGLYPPASTSFPCYLVSPITARPSQGFRFPCDDDYRTPKDVFRIKASRILPFLFLGNEIDCSSEQFLSSCQIRSVLNVTNKVPFLDEKRFRCFRLPAIDMQTQDLRPLFSSAFEFIEQSRLAGDSVLVHCQAGVSRSPSLVIAYLMAYSDLSLRDAYRWVKSKRPVISPNFAFLGQLCDFEADLISGRAHRKPNALDGLISALEDPMDADDFLSLSIDSYMSSRASAPSEVSDSTNCSEALEQSD